MPHEETTVLIAMDILPRVCLKKIVLDIFSVTAEIKFVELFTLEIYVCLDDLYLEDFVLF